MTEELSPIAIVAEEGAPLQAPDHNVMHHPGRIQAGSAGHGANLRHGTEGLSRKSA